MSDNWLLIESQYTPETGKAYEGLFTQGSGYLQIRGSLEEHVANAPQNTDYVRMPVNVTAEKFRPTPAKWGCYVPGVFGKHPLLNWEMVNLPFFLDLSPSVGGEKLDLTQSRIADYRRALSMGDALLTRTLTWHTREGARLELTFERFVSAARPHLCLQRLQVSSDRAVRLDLSAGIDADVRTSGYDHFTSVQVCSRGANGVACQVRTDGQDQVDIESRLLIDGPCRYEEASRSGRLLASISLVPGRPAVIEKRSAIATSRDPENLAPDAYLTAAEPLSYAQLLAEHAAVWKRRWQNSDVIVEGDDQSQLAIRSSIYHLLRVHVPDSRVAVDAKGYAGDAYFGRYFWDTEVCLLPFYLYTNPAAARTLVDFRIQTLAGAKETAASYGYPGARYPWEADHLGRDCCPCWQYRDHEVHVTADVVYGMAHYAAACESGYLSGPAAQVLVETARYWMARIDWRDNQDYPSLLGVMGPDEYVPISSNNAYTNRVVKFALAHAAQVGAAGGADAQECAGFAEVAAKLPILRSADGELVLQCEEFASLAEPRFEQTWRDRSRSFAHQNSQERLYRTKCLKQADVLMMMMMFPCEYTDAQVRRAWDYYVPYTTHDSSLSAGTHAVVACRLGLKEEAWRFWQMSAGLDLDVAHGGAAEGIHIAGAGNNWQILVNGFAGLTAALHCPTLTLRPQLPEAWSRLAFPLIWQGSPVYVEIFPGRCIVTNRGPKPLEVCVCDQPRTIAPGEAASFGTSAA